MPRSGDDLGVKPLEVGPSRPGHTRRTVRPDVPSSPLMGTGIGPVRNIHRLVCDTQAALFCESEPPLRVAHMPLPKSSVARLSPSIILVQFLLHFTYSFALAGAQHSLSPIDAEA